MVAVLVTVTVKVASSPTATARLCGCCVMVGGTAPWAGKARTPAARRGINPIQTFFNPKEPGFQVRMGAKAGFTEWPLYTRQTRATPAKSASCHFLHGRIRQMSGGSGAGFQPDAAGHLARVTNTGWQPELAGRMPAPLLLADISRMRPA